MIPITEIHPMVVHFPIVLWISAEAIAVVVLLRGGDLSDRRQWSATALYSLLAGTVFAVLAAVFGDIALHGILRLLAVWCHYPLTGTRGWLSELPGLTGIGSPLVTAYLSGDLVYRLGVNVAAAFH